MYSTIRKGAEKWACCHSSWSSGQNIRVNVRQAAAADRNASSPVAKKAEIQMQSSIHSGSGGGGAVGDGLARMYIGRFSNAHQNAFPVPIANKQKSKQRHAGVITLEDSTSSRELSAGDSYGFGEA